MKEFVQKTKLFKDDSLYNLIQKPSMTLKTPLKCIFKESKYQGQNKFVHQIVRILILCPQYTQWFF